MNLQRGERQTRRTKKAVETAFLELLDEKSYEAITVNDIVERADIGRSTFYRYFPSKADILLSLHAEVFERFGSGLNTAAAWLADEPPAPLVSLLRQFAQYDGGRVSYPAKVGSDIHYITGQIDKMLINLFEVSLSCAFDGVDSRIPLRLLAQSVAGTYSWLIRGWFMEGSALTAEAMAAHIHHLARAAIREAILRPA